MEVPFTHKPGRRERHLRRRHENPLFAWPVESIADRFGALPDHLPMPGIPEITFARLQELLPSAFVIAFLAGVESLLSAMVADRMIEGRHRPNAELIAQGAANIGSSLFGGLPATGAIARTATNVNAGGKTPVAGIVHALQVTTPRSVIRAADPVLFLIPQDRPLVIAARVAPINAAGDDGKQSLHVHQNVYLVGSITSNVRRLPPNRR